MGETFRQALQALRSNRLRSALTLVGMAIGVFSVIASVTAVEVLDETLMSELASMGTQTITFNRINSDGPPTDEQQRRPQLSYDQALALRERAPLAASVSAGVWAGSREIRTTEEATDPDVSVIATDQDYPQNNGWEMGQGRFLTEADVRAARPAVVLGTTVATELFGEGDPIGREVRVDGVRFSVVGVLAEKSGGMGLGDANNRVVIPITRGMAAFGLQNRDVWIDVRAPSPEMLAATQDQATGALRAIRRLPPEAENNFDVFSSAEAADGLKTFTSALATGGAGIGLIALLAAGVGVMNIMLVSVTERTREIGVRKSLGATRRDILLQFLVEAVVLCQIGGLVGIVLGALGGNVVAALMTTPPAFPWGWAITAVLGVTVVALVFGVYPATQAARLHPIEALRHE
ncbi:ABC transporter permease [Rubrivirga sp. IMCC43871]|uniref:ABC transporter permease n=1 Tax=Rubrivirga sp. IMCC43871 TaxID=3391575 RepID=UPI00398FF9F5